MATLALTPHGARSSDCVIRRPGLEFGHFGVQISSLQMIES